MKAKAIYYDDFSGGLNDTANQRRIKRTEASLLRNWDITYKGQLVRRGGLIAIGSYLQINVSNSVNVSESKTAAIP